MDLSTGYVCAYANLFMAMGIWKWHRVSNPSDWENGTKYHYIDNERKIDKGNEREKERKGGEERERKIEQI